MSAQKAKELRRLFSATKQQRQQQEAASSSSQSSSSRITHGFAKYDANNKLTCAVCSVIIKNESLWNSHLLSLSHKESLRKLKEMKGKTLNIESSGTSSAVNKVAPSIKSPTTTSIFKPKSILKKESSFNNLERESITVNNKKRSVGIEGKITISKDTSINVSYDTNTDNNIKNLIGYDEEEENDSEEEEEKVSEQVRVKRVKYSDDSLTTEQIESISQTSTIPSDFFESQISVDKEDTSTMTGKLPSDFFESHISVDEKDTSTMTSKLPSDFFDDDTASTMNQQIDNSTQETEIVQEKSVLPADFFDSSSLNNSSVKVSTTTEIDEQEWINFQKEISKETRVSNQISNADDEQLQRDRDEMQEREQELCLARLEKLKNVANRVKESREKHMTISMISNSRLNTLIRDVN
ncbi:hypothetical protein C1645_801851 [Glomus cerebriforme]|uniref:ZNF380 coiled-coil domain-containing protein n=1 Tax=Glomus cerebriforme TaxID=658196 RepID=A0A397TQK5_9GLOM|nr:hypothetical protein C1645_801851 [Glomus cerebriforme]